MASTPRPDPVNGRRERDLFRSRASAVQARATREALDHAQDLPRMALTISYQAFPPLGRSVAVLLQTAARLIRPD
jgi:hypothetical protein